LFYRNHKYYKCDYKNDIQLSNNYYYFKNLDNFYLNIKNAFEFLENF